MTHNNPLFNILQDIINNNFQGKTTRTTTLFKNFKCNSPRSKYKINVKTLAPMVPKGMAYPGFFKSPDMLAPAKNYKTFFFPLLKNGRKHKAWSTVGLSILLAMQLQWIWSLVKVLDIKHPWYQQFLLISTSCHWEHLAFFVNCCDGLLNEHELAQLLSLHTTLYMSSIWFIKELLLRAKKLVGKWKTDLRTY